MKIRALVVATVLACVSAPHLMAQGVWVPLPQAGGTKVWADSNSWMRGSNGMVSVRLRTIEARVDGKPSDEGTIQYMDFDCTKKLYRVRRTEFVKGEKVVGILPDSMGNARGWQAPKPDWLEDHQLQASCSRKL